MNPTLRALLDKKQALIDEGNALAAVASADRTDEQKERVKAIPGALAATNDEITQEQAFQQSLKAADASLNGAGGIRAMAVAPEVGADGLPKKLDAAIARAVDVPKARVLGRARATNLLSLRDQDGKPYYSREEANKRAYDNGMFFAATRGNRKALQYCADNGIVIEASQQTESINEDGGYLVPPEFENDLILLREAFGVFRRFARMTPMSSDTKSRPRQTGGLTAFFQGEGTTGTESKAAWDRVTLTAKKLMVLTRTSTELNEDAMIDLGDRLAKEIAYAFAKKEDACGFIGDGTQTYGGIVGAAQRLFDKYGAAGGVGLVLGSGNAFSELTLNDFIAVVGALPQYADTPNARWFCHRTFFYDTMLKVALAAGGVTEAEIAKGGPARYLGYDVEFAQIMPKTDANSQVPVIFGDLGLAADYGDRRQTTLLMSEHVYFASDEIGVRGTERFDINVHDVGNATDAGPIVGLVTAAS